MPCHLTLSGTDFNVDAFIEKSGLSNYQIGRKGESMCKSKPDGKKLEVSSWSADVSIADFNAFDEQASDVIAYLKTNREALQHIQTAEGLEYAYLDFGVVFWPANRFCQSQHLPPELIQLAAEVNISITISMYAPSEKEYAETNLKINDHNNP